VRSARLVTGSSAGSAQQRRLAAQVVADAAQDVLELPELREVGAVEEAPRRHPPRRRRQRLLLPARRGWAHSWRQCAPLSSSSSRPLLRRRHLLGAGLTTVRAALPRCQTASAAAACLSAVAAAAAAAAPT
jgi:hypothetical protein